MASSTMDGVGEHSVYTPYVDTDCRQNPDGSDSKAEPLVAVPLYVSARGLTTSAMPYKNEMLDIEFDFVNHHLHFRLSTGATNTVPFARSQ